MESSKRNPIPEELFRGLEARLAGTLKPIRPSNDMIDRLKERIRFPDRKEIVIRLSDWRKLFLVFGGVMSGLLLLITVARAFFYFVGRKHV